MSLKTLNDVFQESFRNDTFRILLLKSSSEALRSKGWELSPDDMLKLDNFLSHNHVASPSAILQAFSDVLKGAPLPPPPPWQPELDDR